MTMKRLPSIAFILLAMALTLCLSSCRHDGTTEDNIAAKLEGKWKLSTIDGIEVDTNSKTVWTMDGTRISMIDPETVKSSLEMISFEYTVKDKDIIVKGLEKGNSDCRIRIDYIDNHMIVSTETHDGKQGQYVRQKVNKDYSKAILGLWEGREMTGIGTYGDQNHRWEYKADGSYIYYDRNDKGEWVFGQDAWNRYRVDGDMLCTCWKDEDGSINREWWDISECNESEMTWRAFRSDIGDPFNPDAPQATHTLFKMYRVSD